MSGDVTISGYVDSHKAFGTLLLHSFGSTMYLRLFCRMFAPQHELQPGG